MTDKIVGHQSESRIPYPYNQIQILVFYIFHTTKTRLATFMVLFVGKHYPFVSYIINLERCSIVVNQKFTVIKNDVTRDVQSSVFIACHQTLAVWGKTMLLYSHTSKLADGFPELQWPCNAWGTPSTNSCNRLVSCAWPGAMGAQIYLNHYQ